jgi:hypothetical protein
MEKTRPLSGDLAQILRKSRRGLERFLRAVIDTAIDNAKASGRKIPFPPDPPGGPRENRRPARRPFLREIFLGASELHSALQQLKSIVIYARGFPYRNRRITRGGHLRYHFEAYLQEVALIRNRLRAYLSVIERLYRQDAKYPQISRLVTAIRANADDTFRGFVDIRDGHVHEARFADAALANLAAIEVIMAAGYEYSAAAYKKEFQIVKRAKVQWMRAWNRSIEQELDMYFQLLALLITDERRRLRWPPGAIHG